MAVDDDAAGRLAEELVSGAQERFVSDLTRELARRLAQDCSNPDVLATLPRVAREEAMAAWARWRGRVTERCRRAFEEALAREDDEVSRELARAYPAAAMASDTGAGANALAEAARGMAAVIARDNVAFCDDAARRYQTAVADVIARVDAGGSREEAMGRACRALADLGTIDYKSGVRTQLDAAIRRHVVTQANQARNDLLVRRMDEAGCDLVFISSHWGCRPTHEWFQGRVFSRSGANAGKVVADASGRRVTVGRLSDTGYGTVAGLCGANCGHVMYPFSPGDTELPDREFASQEREFGRTGAEQYALTQRQRALERKVRKAKREAAAAREVGADDVPARLALGRAQAELRAFCADNRLTRMPGRERAYGVGAQPRALTSPSLRSRTVAEVMSDDSVLSELRSRGAAKSEFRSALANVVRTRGGSFRALGRADQDAAVELAMDASSKKGRCWISDERRRRERDIEIAKVSVRPVFIEPSPSDVGQATINLSLIRNVRLIKPREGWYDVHAHGSPTSVVVFSSVVDARTLAAIIKGRQDYHGEPIRLFSCHTGEADESGDCFAQRLADTMGVEVDAPPSATYINSDGTFWFGDDRTTEFRRFRPRSGDDFRS